MSQIDEDALQSTAGDIDYVTEIQDLKVEVNSSDTQYASNGDPVRCCATLIHSFTSSQFTVYNIRVHRQSSEDALMRSTDSDRLAASTRSATSIIWGVHRFGNFNFSRQSLHLDAGAIASLRCSTSCSKSSTPVRVLLLTYARPSLTASTDYMAELPEKKTFRKNNAAFIERRREQLHQYMAVQTMFVCMMKIMSHARRACFATSYCTQISDAPGSCSYSCRTTTLLRFVSSRRDPLTCNSMLDRILPRRHPRSPSRLWSAFCLPWPWLERSVKRRVYLGPTTLV